jgi:adenine/guanine phosphoribosyltransferase-like PRPP-binding protein
MEVYDLVYQAFDDKPLIDHSQYRFILNPLTEQIPATTPELLQAATDWIVEVGEFDRANKIAGEEDRGAILVASTSLATGLPFGMARWHPSGMEGQIAVDFEMEYASGTMYLNGIEPGDKVIVVDDMISTGGTMLALIEAVKTAGADIVDIICVAEKLENDGVSRVFDKTGFRVKTLVKFSVEGERSKVINRR